jgi:hypothetical protein
MKRAWLRTDRKVMTIQDIPFDTTLLQPYLNLAYEEGMADNR